MNPDVMDRWQEIEACHAEARRLIDVEYRWMLACLWTCILIVPVPFCFYMFWRTRQRVHTAQARAQLIAERVQHGNFASVEAA